MPAKAESATAADFAEISLDTFSAWAKSNLPFRNARRVNSPMKKMQNWWGSTKGKQQYNTRLFLSLWLTERRGARTMGILPEKQEAIYQDQQAWLQPPSKPWAHGASRGRCHGTGAPPHPPACTTSGRALAPPKPSEPVRSVRSYI